MATDLLGQLQEKGETEVWLLSAKQDPSLTFHILTRSKFKSAAPAMLSWLAPFLKDCLSSETDFWTVSRGEKLQLCRQ